MKKLNLETTWEKCLAMWKWISRQCKGKSTRWCERNINRLKEKWLEDNGFKCEVITQNCFLCNRTSPKRCDWWDCDKCPACKIEPDFDCRDKKYDFTERPRKFYAKLKELNKIRLL